MSDIYNTIGPKPVMYTRDVVRARGIVEIGDKVIIEVYKERKIDGAFELEWATVKAKYRWIVLTDKGCDTWKSVLMHNGAILERIRRYGDAEKAR